MRTKRFHHIFDLENCNGKIMNSDEIRKFVEKIAETIGMRILAGPILAQGIEQNPGLSAVAIVDFSHISVHTFTNFNETLIDVFSCKEYDRERVLQVCKEFFGTPATTVRQNEVWWG